MITRISFRACKIKDFDKMFHFFCYNREARPETNKIIIASLLVMTAAPSVIVSELANIFINQIKKKYGRYE